MILLVSGATLDVARSDPARVGVLLTPRDRNNNALIVDRQWGVDNSAFTRFDAKAFVRLLERCAGRSGCLFVACPDVVGDHLATLNLFYDWRETVRDAGLPIGFIAQDGATLAGVPWESFDALFIGGTTAFKLSHTADALLDEARRRGKWRHVGRVNSKRRMRHFDGRTDSIDGSGFSKWPGTRIPRALRWIEQHQRHPRFL